MTYASREVEGFKSSHYIISALKIIMCDASGEWSEYKWIETWTLS